MKKLNQKGFGMAMMLLFIALLLLILVVAMIIAHSVEEKENKKPLDPEVEVEENMFVTP